MILDMILIYRFKTFPENCNYSREKDKFGDVEVVKNDMRSDLKRYRLLSVKGADHSYRVPETKEPIYEDEAVKWLLNKT